LLGLRVRRTKLLDAQLRKPLTHVDGLLERLALYNSGDEASSESITGSVGVVDLVLADGVDGNLLDIDITTVLRADGDGGVGALGEDNSPCALAVLLGHVGDLLSDLLDVLGFNVVRFGKSGGFGLVTDQDVNVGHDLVERVLEELRDEGRGEVENELLHQVSLQSSPNGIMSGTYLVLSGSLLGQRLDGWYTDGQVETTDVEDLRVLNLLPDALLLQVLELVVVGSSEIGAHGAVVAGDHNTAATSRSLLVVEVFGLDASVGRDLLKRLAVLVLANAANVDDRFGLKNVCSASRSVLRSTTGNLDGLVVLEQVLVQAHVLFGVGEDRIVGLQAILVEESLVTTIVSTSSLLRDCRITALRVRKERN
jgi:hypothetical protein